MVAGCVAVWPVRAVSTEHAITGLAEKQLSARMRTTLRYHFPTLAGHQVEELVDEERGRECGHPAPRYCDQLPTYGTSETACVSGL